MTIPPRRADLIQTLATTYPDMPFKIICQKEYR